jgi:hypothetical protein
MALENKLFVSGRRTGFAGSKPSKRARALVVVNAGMLSEQQRRTKARELREKRIVDLLLFSLFLLSSQIKMRI